MPLSPANATGFILIVDDDQLMRSLLADALADAGFRCEAVASGEEALAFAAHAQPELVVLDLVLPGRDGLETCRELRRQPGNEHLPIVMVTGTGHHAVIGEAFEAGVTDFITKPVNPELFVHRIRFVLRAGQTVRQLARSQQRLGEAQRIARLGHWEWDILANLLWCSQQLEWLLAPLPAGFTPSLATYFRLVHPLDRRRVILAFRRCLGGEAPIDLEHRVLCGDGGQQRWLRLQGEVHFGIHGRPERLAGVLQDITSDRSAENQLLILKEAVDSLPIGINITDAEGRIVYLNRAEAQMHGYTLEELLRQPARLLAPPPGAQEAAAPPATEGGRRSEYKLWQRESRNRRKNGDEFPVQLSSIAVQNRDGEFLGLVTACEDISLRKLAQEQIQKLAYFDSLTQLPNRWMLRDRLAQAIAMAGREERRLGVLFLDLDRFKFINDTMGHGFGDKLLTAVARRLEEGMRRADTVARLGGDEFVVLLAEVDGQNGAAIAARRILDAFALPFALDGREIFTVPSIGVALYPDDGTSVDELLKNADAAMYQAKSFGGQSFRFFSAELNRQLVEKMALESQLRRALDQGEFVLHYQPQYDLASGRMVGVEALVRWQHPEHGLIPPGHFITTMEQTGLIVRLGSWVLETAARQAKAWSDGLLPQMRMGVNISAVQFRQAGFLDTVDRVLADTGVDPTWLEFELTESLVMEDPPAVRELLLQLKQRGIHLSIDDFGTGYSSLSYLRNFPIDRIKIDRSFLSELVHNRDDAAIVEAIIMMASSLNLKVVAEGVESREQVDFLQRRGCHETQGFYYSRPLSADGFMRLCLDGAQPLAESAINLVREP